MRMALSVLLVLLLVPGWSGDPRLDLLGSRERIVAVPVSLDPARPGRRRVGRLTWLGGVALSSPDPAFGGFSSLHVSGHRITLLSDGGNVVALSWLPGRGIVGSRFGNLPAGPGTGWQKADRDSESMAVGPDGTTWVGFENANAIWRYAPGFLRAEGRVRPAAMRRWPANGGAETMVWLADGRFLLIGEVSPRRGDPWRDGLVFAGDPLVRPLAFHFRFRPPADFDPSDAAALPDGSLLVLVRRFRLPYRFDARLLLVPAGAIRPGAAVTGTPIADFTPPVIHDNLEGVAVTREGRDTIVWLCSDDNQSVLQRSLLLKFRLGS